MIMRIILKKINMLKKGDILVGGIVLLLIIASFGGVKLFNSMNSGSGKIAVIRQNNVVIKRIDLDKLQKSETINVDGDYHNTILAENGRIRFQDANCPDLVCVKTGWLKNNGDMAVCLPNKVSVKIEGSGEALDGVAF